MSYEKQNWVSYDDNKTEEQNLTEGAVVTSERMNHVEEGLETAARILLDHRMNYKNPHKVDKGQVGLGNVTNVEQASKADFTAHANNQSNVHKVTAEQTGAYTKAEADGRFAKPSEVNKANVGLSNVDNYATANQTEAETGRATDKFMTPFLVFKAIASWVSGRFVTINENQTIGGVKNFVQTPTVNNKEVLLKEEVPFEAWYGLGTELTNLGNGDRPRIGLELRNIGEMLNRPMKSNPLEWNAERYEATATRDCMLFIEGNCRFQFGVGSNYAYINFAPGYGYAGGVGTSGYTTNKHGINFSRQVRLKKGNKFSLSIEMMATQKIAYTQMNHLHVMEVRG